MSPAAAPIAVIGVGNAFRGDDGVGWSVLAGLRARARREPLPARTSLRTCDGEPARLLGLWQGARAAVVIDAARAGPPSPPGLVRRYALADARTFPEACAASSHGLGLADAIALARVLGRLPRTLIVYTIESRSFELGQGLSASVGAAVAPTVRRVERDVRMLARA